MPSLKNCGGCEKELPREAFNRCARRPDGLQTQCRACQMAAKARWKERNPGKNSGYNMLGYCPHEREREERLYA